VHKGGASQAAAAHQLVALDGHIVLDKHDADVTSTGFGLLCRQPEVELIARVVFCYEEGSAEYQTSAELAYCLKESIWEPRLELTRGEHRGPRCRPGFGAQKAKQKCCRQRRRRACPRPRSPHALVRGPSPLPRRQSLCARPGAVADTKLFELLLRVHDARLVRKGTVFREDQPFFSGINRRDLSFTSKLRSNRTTKSSVSLMKCFPKDDLGVSHQTPLSCFTMLIVYYL
jgi:hypothetical protein